MATLRPSGDDGGFGDVAPAPVGPHASDVVIVGAGVAGLAAAMEIKR